jgi:hypothetical protein
MQLRYDYACCCTTLKTFSAMYKLFHQDCSEKVEGRGRRGDQTCPTCTICCNITESQQNEQVAGTMIAVF